MDRLVLHFVEPGYLLNQSVGIRSVTTSFDRVYKLSTSVHPAATTSFNPRFLIGQALIRFMLIGDGRVSVTFADTED